MKDYKAEWKKLLSDGSHPTCADMFQYQILKAQCAKTPASYEIRVALAAIFLQRAFTPVTNENKLKGGMQPYSGLKSAQWLSRLRTGQIGSYGCMLDCLETEEEQALYSKLWDDATKKLLHKVEELYTFIFIRRDLPLEQMTIQSAHATFVLGSSIKAEKPAEVNFVLCGAENEQHLTEIRQHFADNHCEMVHFLEPDIGGQMTAIASHPLPYSQKRFAARYPKLRIS